jgi:hypothetical protein
MTGGDMDVAIDGKKEEEERKERILSLELLHAPHLHIWCNRFQQRSNLGTLGIIRSYDSDVIVTCRSASVYGRVELKVSVSRGRWVEISDESQK